MVSDHARAPKAAASDKPVTQRLHLSGLAPSVTAAELASRFSSFGTVVGGSDGVSGLGKDANGFPRVFAFLTLDTTEQKLKKCMSMLSGSLWKGHKLRIAFAKPDYQQRLEAERQKAQEDDAKARPVKRKRKRNPDPSVGTLAKHFEVVTSENIERHRGWILDSSAPSPCPIFPLVTRPPHPIERPAKAAPTAWSRGATNKKKPRPVRALVPLARTRRIRIDPRKWGRKKLVYTEEDGNSALWSHADGLRGIWECVDEVEDQSGQRTVTWVFKGKDGQVKRAEEVSLTKRETHTDRFAALLDRMEQSGAKTDTVPLIVGEAADSQPIEDRASVRPDVLGDFTDEVDADDTWAEPARKRLKSASPPPYIPAAPRTLLYNDEDAFAIVEISKGDEEQAEARRRERDAQLRLLEGLLAGGDSTAVGDKDLAGKRLPRVEGFADDSDDDLADLLGAPADQEALRLRGGAASSSSDDSDSDSDDSESSSDSSDSDSDSSENDADGNAIMKDTVQEGASASAEQPKTTLAKGSLKDMFKPKEADASFSLLSGLDLELEPLERSPTPPPVRPAPPPAPAPRAAPVPRRPFVAPPSTGPITPFFAFPSGAFVNADGSVDFDEAAKVGLDAQQAREMAEASVRLLEADASSFWRSETMEQIEAQHQKLRESLQGVVRKRHREAVKRSGKKGRLAAGQRKGEQ